MRKWYRRDVPWNELLAHDMVPGGKWSRLFVVAGGEPYRGYRVQIYRLTTSTSVSAKRHTVGYLDEVWPTQKMFRERLKVLEGT